MSNMTQNAMEPMDMNPAPEMLPPATESEKPEKAKKNVLNIVFAAIAAVIALVALFLPLDAYIVDGEAAMPIAALGVDMPYGVFFLIAGAVATIALTVVTIIAKKSDCYARYAVLASASGLAAQTLFSAILLKGEIDIIPFALTAIGAILYLVMTIMQKGKDIFYNGIHLIFAWIFIAVFAMAAGVASYEVGDMIFVVAAVFALVDLIWASGVLGSFNDRFGSIARGVIELLAAILLCLSGFNKDEALLMILPALIALIHLVVIALFILFLTNTRVEKAKEDIHRTFTVEEYAEAYPYEGGPVAGVQMAEEVNPTFRPLTPHVNTAGYDFYNSKSFDPFIATLNTQERNDFTEIFILKFRGTMNELPDYVVGGDNKEFFRKIFIYLGQYRDRIPSDLLTKMYQFSLKIS